MPFRVRSSKFFCVFYVMRKFLSRKGGGFSASSLVLNSTISTCELDCKCHRSCVAVALSSFKTLKVHFPHSCMLGIFPNKVVIKNKSKRKCPTEWNLNLSAYHMERGTFRFYLRLMRSTLFKTLIMRFFVWNLRWEENQVTDLGHRRPRKVSFYLGVPHIISSSAAVDNLTSG